MGGQVPYGEMDQIVKAYQEAGCKGVTWANLYYRLSQMKFKQRTLIGTSLEYGNPMMLNDVEGLNGKFKLELTREKRKYLLAQGSPEFEPTDIVPSAHPFLANFTVEPTWRTGAG